MEEHYGGRIKHAIQQERRGKLQISCQASSPAFVAASDTSVWAPLSPHPRAIAAATRGSDSEIPSGLPALFGLLPLKHESLLATDAGLCEASGPPDVWPGLQHKEVELRY